MGSNPDGLIEVIFTGIVLIILGTVLAPLLPFNVAALGVILVVVATLAGIVVVGLTIAQALKALA